MEEPWLVWNIWAFSAAVGVTVVALAALVFFQLIYKSPEDRYLEEENLIRLAVVGYYSGFHPDVPTGSVHASLRAETVRFLRYATLALRNAGTANALPLANVGNTEIETLGPESNPVGNYQDQSRTPRWEDVDGDGIRNPSGEKLFYENASPSPTVDHWNTSTVAETETGTEYVVDSRDWFIDMQRLLETFYIEELPASASRDNHRDGAGSYSWYIDEHGEVRSLFYSNPVPTSGGFRGVYPYSAPRVATSDSPRHGHSRARRGGWRTLTA